MTNIEGYGYGCMGRCGWVGGWVVAYPTPVTSTASIDGTIYVASGKRPGDLGGPCLWFCSLFRQFCVNVLWTCCFRSASLVFGCYVVYGTVTSCVTSWHCTCIGHVTFYYKRSAGTSFWALFALAGSFGSWFIQQVHPCHLRMAGV